MGKIGKIVRVQKHGQKLIKVCDHNVAQVRTQGGYIWNNSGEKFKLSLETLNVAQVINIFVRLRTNCGKKYQV